MWVILQRLFVLAWMSHEVFVNNGQRPYLLVAITGFGAAVEMYRRDKQSQARGEG